MLTTTKPSPPSGDKRWKTVDRTMRRYGYESSALIQTLHTVQENFGYLDEDAMKYVARSLNAPLSQVYGVATFYHFFTLKPQGDHTCIVCTGTACYIKGAESLLDALRQTIGTGPGETSADGRVSVLTARCIGSCGLAPVALLDGEMAGRITPEQIRGRVDAWSSLAGQENIEGGGATAPPEGPAPQLPRARETTGAEEAPDS